jgi:hypothetical protein
MIPARFPVDGSFVRDRYYLGHRSGVSDAPVSVVNPMAGMAF